jgi:Diadenosine tetraphosphate (Ap4A) hydrolase and other HIT family hydrolases
VSLKNLWAPWRMIYVESWSGSTHGCFLCDAARNPSREKLVLERNSYALTILNLYPYNPGHLLVAPVRHVDDFSLLGEEESLGLYRTLLKWMSQVMSRLKPDGLNVGVNIGVAGGAGLPDHLHIHVVPRWRGDTDFMPIVASTKVMPELLESTYQKLTQDS